MGIPAFSFIVIRTDCVTVTQPFFSALYGRVFKSL